MSGHDERAGRPEWARRAERAGDDGRAEHHEHDEHAGNGTVNHGPEGQGPEGPEDMGTTPGDQRLDAIDALGSDELALRRMLHQAVQEIEPTDGTLEHLRRAVPARRARKRQALVGMAAAALFIGTAVPALVHVSNATGSNADPSIAGQASNAQGGASQGKGPDGGSSGSAGNSGSSKGTGKDGEKGKGDKGKGASSGTTGGANPTNSAVSAPACTAAQLGVASQSAGSPDSTGAVYGSFRIANVSGAGCTIPGPGTVSVTANGAADQSKLGVVEHVAGDAAGGLPDPSQYLASLVLQPGAAYEVKFAWVPSATCPTTGTDPSPDPTPSGDSSSASGGTSSEGVTGTSTQLMRADGVQDGSVVVSHTTAVGSPTAAATVSNACAGTVYRTGVLAGA